MHLLRQDNFNAERSSVAEVCASDFSRSSTLERLGSKYKDNHFLSQLHSVWDARKRDEVKAIASCERSKEVMLISDGKL